MGNLFDDIINGKEPDMNDLVNEAIESFDEGTVLTESAYPESLPYLKTMTKKMMLPKGEPLGKGNVCFLYTHDTKESFDMMTKPTNFMSNNKYYYYYYNMFYRGKLYNKTFRIKELEKRQDLYRRLKTTSKVVHPYLKQVIDPRENRNMYYDLSRYIEIYEGICEKLQPSRKLPIFWNYLSSILFSDMLNGYNKRFVLVDAESFTLGKNLKENLKNPLYIIFYSMYRYLDLLKDIDIDFYFYTKKFCLKVNPSKAEKKTYEKLRTEMKRLYAGVQVKAPVEVETITTDEYIKKEEAKDETIGEITSTITKNDEINNVIIKSKEDMNKVIKHENEIVNTIVTPKVEEASKKIDSHVNTDEVPKETLKNAVSLNTEESINDDKETLEKIYNKMIAPSIPKNTASTERDKLLKQNQENLKIGNMTIKDIEKIQTEKVKIPVKDVSGSVRTTNKNMQQLRFDNIEKTYNEKVMPKDITNAILSFNDKSLPLFVRDVKVQDSSDELNYKDTYTVYMEDSNRKRHTIKFDVPKFIDDKFLYIGGNKKIIKKQSFLYPVVKTNEDIVQIVTNYNKMYIQRTNTKSIASVERLKKILKTSEELKTYCTFGNTSAGNRTFVTTIEYDELSKVIISFIHGKTNILFDQNSAHEYATKHNIKLQENHLFVGTDSKGLPIFINDDTQKTKDNKTIVQCMMEACSTELQEEFLRSNSPKRLMYAKAKVMEQFISIGLLLGFWEGLTSVLKKANIKFHLENQAPKELKDTEESIKFADCYLVYEATVGTSLILNGFRLINTAEYTIDEMDSREAYMPYIINVYGTVTTANALLNTYEFIIDPITLEVLQDLNLPTDIVSLIIYAVSLLADSQYTPEIDQNLSRIRSNEIIPAILYERLAKNYIYYRNSNGRKTFSVPQDCVIKELLALKTVEDYSTLNPTLELEMSSAVSTKGFRGINQDDSYTIEKRSYDPSMIGVIAPSSSPDGSVGVNRTLAMEPTISSVRGYVDINTGKLDKLKDVNVFSPAELTIPLGNTIDDPTRLGHGIKQSKHVIPVKNSSPVLISNGMEEICRFKLSSDFVINAEESGEIVDYDEKTNIMIAKYKSGKCRAIDLNETIVKNGGGGFFLSNKLITTLKVGSKFKENDVLAYHKDFFTNDKFNNCRMNMGTLSKVAIMSTYNTYQDATLITEKLSDDCSSEMCFNKQVTIGKNANVEYIVKKGQEIKVGESLVQFDTSFEDNMLNTLLASLNEEDKKTVLEGTRNDIKSKYSGVIEDIKIYSTVDVDELSPTLREIVRSYYNTINHKKRFLEKYDDSTGIVKCGVLCNETTSTIEPNKFGVIKGQKVEDGVMIEFYIKHSEPLEVGSKIANFTGLKNTIGEIIPKGYEPYGHFRPDEEISTFIASNSILKRMTPSILLTSLGNKTIVELKRKLKEIYDEK